MAYDLYPAVDENYNFPPEVRAALAKSVELRNQIVSMTTADRNNLTAAEKWDGRFILNTDLDRIQRYDAASSTWSTAAEAIDAVAKVTTAVRDNLSGVELFDGRLILNADDKRIQRYDLTSDTWKNIIEESDLPLLLTDTQLPLPGVGSGAVGTSDEGARADHQHPAVAGPQTQVFTASGTWTKPAGAVRVVVELWGGGGAGIATNGIYFGGGGGGGYFTADLDAASLGATETVVVGAGATYNVVSTQAGSSTFAGYKGDGGWTGQSGAGRGGGPGPGDIAGSAPGLWGGGGGANGQNTSTPGQDGVFGAGGGGVISNSYAAKPGGKSYFGGAGASTGVAPQTPGGGGLGGNATLGPGARGEVRIHTYF